jgi:hypothetical protein
VDDRRCSRRARRLIPSIVAFATIAFPSLTFAQRFDDVGVRAQGMAGAFVAVADDASATWWNPAGLATGLNVVDLSAGVMNGNGRSVAFTFPSLGLSYYRLKTSQIQPLSPIESAGSGRQDNGAVSQFGATFGHSIAPQIVLATTVKLVSAVSETQADADLGVMATFGAIRLGATVRDLRNPTFGSGADAFSPGRRARAGAAFIGSGRGALDRLVFAVDADLNATPFDGRDERDVAAGLETWWLGRRVGVRAGGGVNTAGGGGSFGAFGASVAPYPRLNIDGAVTRGSDSARNRWSFGVRVTF